MIIKKYVQVSGRIGANPIIINLANGKKIARFLIAVNNTHESLAGIPVNEVQWHRVCAWNELANFAESSLFKGVMVTIDGSLVRQSFISKTGHARFHNEINASDLFLHI